MPEWFDPILNTSLATGLIGFACWGAVRLCRFFGPKITAIADGHVQMMATMGETQRQIVEGVQRQTGMLHDHGNRLDSHGRLLEVHGDQLQTIARRVGAEIVSRSDAIDSKPEGIRPSQAAMEKPL